MRGGLLNRGSAAPGGSGPRQAQGRQVAEALGRGGNKVRGTEIKPGHLLRVSAHPACAAPRWRRTLLTPPWARPGAACSLGALAGAGAEEAPAQASPLAGGRTTLSPWEAYCTSTRSRRWLWRWLWSSAGNEALFLELVSATSGGKRHLSPVWFAKPIV